MDTGFTAGLNGRGGIGGSYAMAHACGVEYFQCVKDFCGTQGFARVGDNGQVEGAALRGQVDEGAGGGRCLVPSKPQRYDPLFTEGHAQVEVPGQSLAVPMAHCVHYEPEGYGRPSRQAA
jgi:hypothetical protein